MTQVGVVGYGTIGKRVADAVALQPDMTVAGVAKRSEDAAARAATRKGFDVYTAGDPFPTVEAVGDVRDLVAASDVVVDTTPSGVGRELRDLYWDEETPAVFQGGEGADVAETSFNARANYDEAVNAPTVRVVSCNSTALARTLSPFVEGYDVTAATATIVRRGGDPDQTDRGPINDILPDPVSLPSHHGPDVQTVLDVPLETAGMKVPATLMHLQHVSVTFDDGPDEAAVRDLLAAEPRVALVPGDVGVEGCAALKEYAMDLGRPRGDVWESAVFADSVTASGDRLHLFQAVHQESDVVPENVDAVRAVTGEADGEASRRRTDEALGVGLDFDAA